jgi:hypothetical protein
MIGTENRAGPDIGGMPSLTYQRHSTSDFGSALILFLKEFRTGLQFQALSRLADFLD